MPKGLKEEVEALVKKGIYANKSEAVREALRKLFWEDIIGSIPNDGDSVKQVREIRKKLSKEPYDLDYVNSL